MAGCSSSSDLDPAELELTAVHAEPDPVRGGRLVDAQGRTLHLRGANINALVEYWSGNDFPTVFPLSEDDVDMMASMGWSVARLLISWSRVEPSPGQYDEAYLDEVERHVDLLASRGIYVLIDFHQDAWGATLAAPPDEVCESGEPAIGWDGAPEWATIHDDEPRCFSLTREFSPAVERAFDAFWNDEAGPGGVGIRTRYVAMFRHVVDRFAGRPEVLGFDVMNEPNAFSPAQQEALSQLYAQALVAMREVEAEKAGPPSLLFFEPSATWSAIGMGAPPPFEHDDGVVYSPHIYRGGILKGPIVPEAFQVAVDEAAGFGGAPVFTGEWGAAPERAEDPGDGYFIEHQRLQEEFGIGATIWTWRESCGDPHKVADARAGADPPIVWGEFDVDCRTNEIRGVREALVNQLTRAYVRAGPGRVDSMEYDPASGRFAASGSDAELGSDLQVFYPVAQHGEPRPSTEGLADVTLVDGPSGSHYLTALVDAPRWSIVLD